MRRVVEPLRLMGAEIRVTRDGFPPLTIRGAPLRSIEYQMPLASAQVKSAILLAGLFADGWTSILEPSRTRDHTEMALREFGAAVEIRRSAVRIRGGAPLLPRVLRVPGDISSAAFLTGAALITPGSQLLIRNVGLNPTRSAFLDVLASWGAPISLSAVREEAGELFGEIAVQHGPLAGGVIESSRISLLIDELPLLAALGPYTERGVEFRGAAELRRKESDRIAALAHGLRSLGAGVTEFEDGLRVTGKSAGALQGAKLESAGDHRVAMALAVAALAASGESTLRDAECVRISFPGFWEVLEKLRGAKS
jgi:3-phosphoshikimate 1-carboxyvinyltransferase